MCAISTAPASFYRRPFYRVDVTNRIGEGSKSLVGIEPVCERSFVSVLVNSNMAQTSFYKESPGLVLQWSYHELRSYREKKLASDKPSKRYFILERVPTFSR